MKRVVSVSLGSSRADKTVRTTLLGEEFELSRIGTNGDMKKFADMVRELDGNVDAIGLGGIDRYLFAGKKRYTIRDADKLAKNAVKTPVVDGSGIKNTLERETIEWLNREGMVDFGRKKVLLVCAVDRFGMAEVLHRLSGQVVYGDIMFSLGLPIPLRSWTSVRIIASLLLPIICRLPFQWVYPTGEKQDVSTPKYGQYFAWADVVAGDYPIIRRFLPTVESGEMRGKTLVTNTLTEHDIESLRERGVDTVVTSTREFEGRTFATNVVEGICVALSGKRPEDMSAQDYLDILNKLEWKPTVRRLQE